MKFIRFIKRIFSKKRKRVNLYSDAIAEGIKDTMKEFGNSPRLADDR